MGASFVGVGTVGGFTVGETASLSTVGNALSLSGAILARTATIAAQISAAVSAQVSAIASAKAAIRAIAIADLNVQVSAAASIGAQLTADLGNPTAYLNGLIAGNAQIGASLALQVPTVTLSDQIVVTAAVGVAAEAKIAAIDAQLALLDSITAALNAQITALLSLESELSVAAEATLPPLSAFASMTATLGAAGAYVFLYDGVLSGFGAAIDAVIPTAGVSGSVNVRIPLIFVQSSNPPGIDAVNAVFKVS